MLKVRYKVEFLGDCLIWTESAPIFRDFLQPVANDKMNSTDPDEASISKALLSQLHGKFAQKKDTNFTSLCKNDAEIYSFMEKNDVINFEDTDNGILLTGAPYEKQGEILYSEKLMYYETFILAYSRKVMLDFMKIIDPTLTTNVYFQTATDSLMIDAAAAQKLMDAGRPRQHGGR